MSPLFKPSRLIFKNPTADERIAMLDATRFALFERLNYFPHISQCSFHLSLARFRTLIAGTRGGKSLAASMEIVAYLFCGATRVWIVGQNYNLCEKEFRYVYQMFTSDEMMSLFGGKSPIENAVYNESQGNMYLRTIWGSEVVCISVERPRGAFGEEVDLICLSEAAQIKNPQELYERVLFGRLASRHGYIIIPTTPAGESSEHDKDGWIHSMYVKGYSEDPDYFTVEWPSWENPYFTEDPIWLRSWMHPLLFAEQYGGQFVSFSGRVFDNFDVRVHVIAPFIPPGHWRRYESIDPGFSGKFVWTSSVVTESGIIIVNDEYSDSETDYETRTMRIKERRAAQYDIHPQLWDTFVRKYGTVTKTWIDPEDPQCAAEMTKLGIICDGNVNKKDILVSADRVNRRLKYADSYPPTLFLMSNCTEHREALANHKWGEKHGTDIRKPANDEYKHYCDNLRYICAGTIIHSEPFEPVREYKENENDMWKLIEELHTQYGYGSSLIDTTAEQRRAML